MNNGFKFSISDLALFLGKAPVTIRGWEKKKIVSLPRASGGDRELTVVELEKAVKTVHKAGRITKSRTQLILATLTMLKLLENKE